MWWWWRSDRCPWPARQPRPSTRQGIGLELPANGFLLLWADMQPEQGPIHLTFSLAKRRGQLTARRPDGLQLERLEYRETVADYSYARLPECGDSCGYDDTPTPGSTNK